MAIEIKLPELGDGIESGDVLEVLVKEGDVVQQDQGVVELETDKATVEVPSSHGGTVTAVHVAVGDTVKIGAALVTVEPIASAGVSPQETHSAPPAAEDTSSPDEAAKENPPEPPPAPKQAPAEPQQTQPSQSPPAGKDELATSTNEEAVVPPKATAASSVAAGPAVRRFAREVGVDLTQVQGSGAGGRITRDDVLAVVRSASRGQQAKDAATETDDWGPVRRERMPKIRRTIADRMLASWTTAPRVTNYDDADVTELERIRKTSKDDYAEKGIKLTAMPFVIKAVAMALREHPTINAALDMEAGNVVYKEYCNIGIAVDTERGLVVPSLRKADERSIPDIARELARLAELVRSGKFEIDDLRGSTFTISNLGAIGGTYSTPIINVPEVAILLTGRSRKMPVVVNDEVSIRLMMPLSLSYDHRLVDGATAARFLNEVIGYLEAPGRLLLAP